ncbi:cytochrome P450 [Aspergillus egyptiacus]|nr:cytochrome P450 [Aspergillus egyptiacus]
MQDLCSLQPAQSLLGPLFTPAGQYHWWPEMYVAIPSSHAQLRPTFQLCLFLVLPLHAVPVGHRQPGHSSVRDAHSPPDIPRIPIYTFFLASWRKLSNSEIYNRWIREPLEQHGAVVFWNLGRWSVLVGHPDLLSELLRNEAVYEKFGQGARSPHGALGALLGNNIINAAGADHDRYKSIMQPGIQRRFDPAPFADKAGLLVERLLAEQRQAGPGRGIAVFPWLQKSTIDLMALSFLGFDLQALDDAAPIVPLFNGVIQGAFHHTFMTFPILDRLAWLIPSRRRAFQRLREFDHTLKALVVRSKTDRKQADSPSTVVADRLVDALQAGELTEYQFRSNLAITFMVGHDNNHFFLASIMMVLGQNPRIQDRIRTEAATALGPRPTTASLSQTQALDQLPYLTSFIYEMLRLYPPGAYMLNRQCTRPARLGDRIALRAGTSIGWTAYGVHTNARIWGCTAMEFVPERWGSTIQEIRATVRRETARGNYIPFNAYARKCLGQESALLEVKVAVVALVSRLRWRGDPAAEVRMNAAALTFPLGLKVIVEEVGVEA